MEGWLVNNYIAGSSNWNALRYGTLNAIEQLFENRQTADTERMKRKESYILRIWLARLVVLLPHDKTD
jgi:hypothetical protein